VHEMGYEKSEYTKNTPFLIPVEGRLFLEVPVNQTSLQINETNRNLLGHNDLKRCVKNRV